MQRFPKVLILSSCIHGGGAGRSLEVFLKYAGREIQADIVMPEPGILAERLTNVEKIWYVPEFVERIHRSPYRWVEKLGWRWLHLVANWYAIPRSTYRILQIAKKIQPDLIYCNHMLAKPVGAFVGSWLGIPVVMHARNVHVHWFGKRFYQFLGRLSTTKLILCNSEASAACFRKYSNDKVRVVNNFVDLAGLQRSQIQLALRKEYQIPPKAPIVGYFGRLLPKKGIDLLIRAFAQVHQTFPEVYLALVGDNDSGYIRNWREEYSELAKELGIGKNVILTGFKEDIRPYMADIDILTLPSVEPESFGRTLIEAMAFGLPCVATKHGGAVEVVQNGGTGLLVEPGKVEPLAHALTTLVANPTLRQQYGTQGLKRVQELFNGEKLGRLIAFYLQEAAAGEGDTSRQEAKFFFGTRR